MKNMSKFWVLFFLNIVIHQGYDINGHEEGGI